MKNDFENQLKKLQEEYKKNLPNKINEINALWAGILAEPADESLNSFHRKVHSMHGTAGTYGHEAVSKVSAKLEILANTFKENPSTISANAEKVHAILAELQKLAATEIDQLTVMPVKKEPITDTFIYLLDNEKPWADKLINRMKTFNYNITGFTDKYKLIKEIQQRVPPMLIININMMDNELEGVLLNYTQNPIPIIFIATQGDFNSRLKAVRCNGIAYFIKPVATEDLISKIDLALNKDTTPIKILIVEDEMEVAQYNSLILEQAGMKTVIVTHSSEVDRIMHEFAPDVLLVDFYMPECNGHELAEIIRQQSAYQSIPIVYLSSEEDKLKQLQAMTSGADVFVTKSTPANYLILIIKNVVSRYKSFISIIIKDHLTGLYNYSFMLKQVDIELKNSMRAHNPLSIVLIDVDKFKKINESYGHQMGDQILVNLGLMLSKRIREGDIVGRYSGNQFLVILPNTTEDVAFNIIDDLRKQFLSLNYSHDKQIFNATFSATITSFPNYHTPKELLEAAEQLMIASKKIGKNRVEAANLNNTSA